jgi:hypothetical protein
VSSSACPSRMRPLTVYKQPQKKGEKKEEDPAGMREDRKALPSSTTSLCQKCFHYPCFFTFCKTYSMEFHAKASAGNGLVDDLHKEYDNLLSYVAARDATLCYSAMAGMGCDQTMLIKILCNRTKDQIAAIDGHYRSMTANKSHQSLHDRVVSETSGNYGHFMKYLTQNRGDFLAGQLHLAMVDLLIIICEH